MNICCYFLLGQGTVNVDVDYVYAFCTSVSVKYVDHVCASCTRVFV